MIDTVAWTHRDVNHLAYGWVKSGADLNELVEVLA